MTIHDPNWKTATAAESRVPGYLARRFAKIRRDQKAEADAAAAKLIDAETGATVTAMTKRAKS